MAWKLGYAAPPQTLAEAQSRLCFSIQFRFFWTAAAQILAGAIVQLTGGGGSGPRARGRQPEPEGYTQLFGDSNLRLHGDGKRVHISLDERTGSGFASQAIAIASGGGGGRCPTATCTRRRTTSWTSSSLGTSGAGWRVQTNVYGDGSTAVGREERYGLWSIPKPWAEAEKRSRSISSRYEEEQLVEKHTNIAAKSTTTNLIVTLLSYKNGFVWHDLAEDDLVLPATDGEYVLKGSELLDQPSSVVSSFACLNIQVVGWPPVGAYRKPAGGGLYVKVSMDGGHVLRRRERRASRGGSRAVAGEQRRREQRRAAGSSVWAPGRGRQAAPGRREQRAVAGERQRAVAGCEEQDGRT
ncbi:hypothetical protein QYE76_012441 [Lolium multiflorum]|uniref:SOSEKI DIX-like domain-containing protein n=1 Tax=Lolium multiflorum TaxID=4521 RepID=A0AAD8U1U4_LOLMU|nr:hypothetical protein QYE76_012441 [Lolium multiflorum]